MEKQNDFGQLRRYPVATTQEFITRFLDDIYTDVLPVYYRGLPDADYELLPSVGRQRRKDVCEYLNSEKRILDEFKRRALPYLPTVPQSDFEWLFIAQHHGLPTRLLDWTTNPLVALYFAVASCQAKHGCIYRVHQMPTIPDLSFFDPFHMGEPRAVVPPVIHQRFANQAGLFTVGNPFEPFTHESLRKVVIDAGFKEETVRWLRRMGITSSFLFPSLDSLAAELGELHGFSTRVIPQDRPSA